MFKNTVSEINQNIKNDNPFFIKTYVSETSDAEDTRMKEIAESSVEVITFMEETLQPKVLNEKALENMRKKGITPKKQAGEVPVFIITACCNGILMAVNIPSENSFKYDSLSGIIDKYHFELRAVGNLKGRSVCYLECPTLESFKVKDEVQQDCFNLLKELKIYIPDEEEDMVFDF